MSLLGKKAYMLEGEKEKVIGVIVPGFVNEYRLLYFGDESIEIENIDDIAVVYTSTPYVKPSKKMEETIRILNIGFKEIVYETFDDIMDISRLVDYGFLVEFVRDIRTGFFKTFVFKYEYQRGKILNSTAYKVIKAQAMSDERVYKGREYHLSMAELLGIPYKAAHAFADKTEPDEDVIPVSFCGLHFSSYKNTIHDDIKWLYDNSKDIDESRFLLEIYKDSFMYLTDTIVRDKSIRVIKRDDVESVLEAIDLYILK